MIQTLKTKLKENENPVGTKKISNFKLPQENFTYGKQEKPDKEGVSVITRSWLEHKTSKKVEPPQDFVKINKLAVKMNATKHDVS